PFQRQEAPGKGVCRGVPDEIPAVLAQDFEYVGLRIPTQRAPDEFVDVIVATLRISEESDCAWLRLPEDRSLTLRPRINTLTRFSNGVSGIPIRNRVLALP